MPQDTRQQDEQASRQRLLASIAQARGTTPDQEAQVQATARATGAPAVALRGLPQAEWPAVQPFNPDALLRDYGRTANFLSNPDHARLAHDDTGPMTEIERHVAGRAAALYAADPHHASVSAAPPIRPTFGSIASGLWASLVGASKNTVDSGALQLAEMMRGGRDALGDGLLQNDSRNTMRDLRATDTDINRRHPDVRGAGALIYGGAESTLQAAPTIAAALLFRNPAPVLAVAGLQTDAQAYGKYRLRGGTPEQARVGAAGEGAVEVATELIPMGFLTSKLGKVGAGEFLTGLLAREVPGELAATMAQDAIDTAIANPDKTWGDYWAERPNALMQTVVATAMQAGVMEGVHVGVRSVANHAERQNQQAAAVHADADGLQMVAEAAASSKLRERSPQTFEAFVAAAAEGGPVENVYVDAQVFAQSIQDAGLNIDQIAADVPAVGQQLDEAIRIGGDLSIPVEQFAARIAGTDAAEPLMDHLRVNPALPSRAEVNALSLGQSEAIRAEAEAIFTAATTNQAFRDSAQKVKDGLVEQLQTAGRFTKDVNTAYATMVSDFYAVTASKLGITPEEMAAKFKLNITSETPGSSTANTSLPQSMDEVRLSHFSATSGLTATNPSLWGANSATPAGERTRARAGDAPGRTYFYDTAVRQEPESALRDTSPFRYDARVPRSSLYDFDADPQGLRGKDPSTYEAAIRKAGFKGYFSNAVVPGAVAVFDPVPLEAAGPVRTTQDAHFVSRRMREMQHADRMARVAAAPADAMVTAEPLENFRAAAEQELADSKLVAPLEGAPKTAKVGDERVAFGPFAPARRAAYDYMAARGLQYQPPTAYAKVDAARAGRIADEFEQMAHNPNDPQVRAAYRAMIEETLAQWQAVKATGLEVEFIDFEKTGDPYAVSPRMAIMDVVQNNHLWVFPTDDGFGSDATDISGNPLLEMTDEWLGDKQLRANDVFRIVHDYFGHIKDGTGFRAEGEENAWQSHAAMFSPLARRAMTVETRGQNSWVNYGPHAAANKTASGADTVYAPQKIGLLPDWVSEDGFLGGENTGTVAGEHPATYNQTTVQPPFYSALARAVAETQTKRASAEQWKATLAKTAGVKKDEIEWSGVNDWLDNIAARGPLAMGIDSPNGTVPREAILGFLNAGGVQLEEVVLGAPLIDKESPYFSLAVADAMRGASTREDAVLQLENDHNAYATMKRRLASSPRLQDDNGNLVEDWAEIVVDSVWSSEGLGLDGAAQFSSYKLPGADDTYREVLLTLPAIQGPSTHWDTENVVAHARLTMREDAAGAKVLFIEEVQSDWHQKGRDEGYAGSASEADKAKLREAYHNAQGEREAARQAVRDTTTQLLEAKASALEAVFDEAKAAGGSVLEDIQAKISKVDEGINFLHRGGDPYRILADNKYPINASHPDLAPVYRAFNDANLRAQEASIALDGALSGIPDAPFRTSWSTLVMKRMIRYAVDNGADKVAWINGNQQNGGQTGGDGSFFYERNLVNTTNDLLKKMGGRVEPVDFRDQGEPTRSERHNRAVDRLNAGADLIGEPTQDEIMALRARPATSLGVQNGFAINDRMREIAAQGFPLFQPNRGQITFGGDITQSPSVISLLQTADLSTFLHETGHFFLEVNSHIAKSEGAPAEIVADMDALLGWFKPGMTLTEWSAMTLDEKRPYHEQFARGFEAYLFEGRAPTVGLRPLFQKFRSWLLNVYKSISALDVQLTDEVRSVMGRMVASAEAIKETEDSHALAPLFETKPTYMTDAAWEDYQRQFAAATEDGLTNLSTRTVRDMQWLSNAKSRTLKLLQREADDKRKAVRAEITDQVRAEPVNRARQFLTRGTDAQGEPVEGAGKLDLETLRAMYGDGPDALWRQLRRGGKFGEAGNNGLHPDVAAELFGFESGDALVRALTSAENMHDKIAGLTDQTMLERYGDISDPDALERAANEAVANDARARFVATEMAVLSEVTGKPRALAEAAREHAAGIVNRMELKRMRPAQFFAAQTRAAKAAEKAIKKDDLPEAARQKRNQLINLQAAKYTLKAQAEVDKALNLFKRIVSAKDEGLAKSRDMNLVNAARAILAAYGVGRAKNDPASYLDALSRYDPTLYADLKPFIDGARGAAKPIPDLTFEQFQGLRDTVNQLWALARRTRQVVIDGQNRDLDAVREELGQHLDGLGEYPADPVGSTRAPTDAEKFGRMLQGARASLRRVEAWARSVDATDNGPFRRLIWNPISTASDNYRMAQRDYLQRFLDLVKPIEATLAPAKIAAAEIGYTFNSKAELLHAILHTGNRSNQSKLLLGRNWGKQTTDGDLDTTRWDALVSRLISEGKLTKADYDFAQSVWDLMDETKPGAQAAHLAIYGRYFDEVAADPVETPFGTYRGGYVPALTDAYLVQDAVLRSEQEAIEGGDSAMFPAASNGFTKARVEDYTRELALDLRLLPMHLDKVLKFTHLGPPVRDVARVLKGRAFSAKLQAFDPVAQTDLLLPWLQRSAKQIVETPSKGQGGKLADRFFKELRSRTGTQLMFANVSNTLQQVTGLSSIMLRVKPGLVGASLWRYVRAPKETTAAVAGMSSFMSTRTTSQMFEARQTIEQMLLNPSKYDKLRDFAQRHGYFMQTAAQNLVDVIGWSAAYDQAVGQGQDDKEAIRFADSVVRETQGSFAPEDVSRFETGSPFVRLFTQFYSYFNMQANLLGTEYQTVARTTGVRKGAGRLAYVYAMGFAVPAALADLIAVAMRGGWDDDEGDGYLDEALQWFFGSQLKFAVAGVPVVGQVTNAAYGAFTPVPYDDRVSVSPAVAAVEAMVKVPAEVYQTIVKGESFNGKDVKDTFTLLGIMTGLPLGAVGRPAGYLTGVAEGDTKPTSALDMARGTITGTASPASRQ